MEILYRDNISTMLCLFTKETGLLSCNTLMLMSILGRFVQCGCHLNTQSKRKLIILIYIYGPNNPVKIFFGHSKKSEEKRDNFITVSQTTQNPS